MSCCLGSPKKKVVKPKASEKPKVKIGKEKTKNQTNER